MSTDYICPSCGVEGPRNKNDHSDDCQDIYYKSSYCYQGSHDKCVDEVTVNQNFEWIACQCECHNQVSEECNWCDKQADRRLIDLADNYDRSNLHGKWICKDCYMNDRYIADNPSKTQKLEGDSNE